LHQVGTSSLLTYMMHGHTYINFHSCMEKAEHRKTTVLSKHQTVPDTVAMHSPKCIPNTDL